MNYHSACIFDLDGVIVDTARYHFKAWQRLAHSLEIPFTEDDNHKLRGLSRRKSLKIILQMGDRILPEDRIQELMVRKNSWYQEYISELDSSEILEGVPAILDELEAENIKMAIGSSSKNAKRILKAIGLTHRFGAIVDGASVQNTKPDPEVFLKGAKQLGVDPPKCIVFEDAVHGVHAAQRAGMYSVGIGSPEHLGEADAVIPSFKGRSFNDIRELLKS